VTLSDWLFRAVAARSVLTLSATISAAQAAGAADLRAGAQALRTAADLARQRGGAAQEIRQRRAAAGVPRRAARDDRGLPGVDVYALEAEWRAWWVATGRPTLRAPDRAFLGWVKGKTR
jgi:hypothetical protein